MVDQPYFAPPDEDFPGRPAAPYYRPELAAEKAEHKSASPADPNACRGCELRDEAHEIYCRVCGKAFDEPDGDRLKAHAENTKNTRRELLQDYIAAFVSTAGTRFLVLILEDVPQAIMIIMCVVECFFLLLQLGFFVLVC
jgi:hypothetical protein